MIASLPMYDWPEIRPQTNALWTEIANALSQAGIAAPQDLCRYPDPVTHWPDPALILSQTCGWPLVAELLDQVELLGSFAYQELDCPLGDYYSVIVEGASKTAPAAVNDMTSQSGYAAMVNYFGIVPRNPFITGSHRQSIRSVATGRASYAAIDAVSWGLAQRYEPTAGDVRVTAQTDATPGLPLITAKGRDTAPLIDALHHAARSDAATALGITGFVPRTKEDYRGAVGIRL